MTGYGLREPLIPASWQYPARIMADRLAAMYAQGYGSEEMVPEPVLYRVRNFFESIRDTEGTSRNYYIAAKVLESARLLLNGEDDYRPRLGNYLAFMTGLETPHNLTKEECDTIEELIVFFSKLSELAGKSDDFYHFGKGLKQ